MELELGLALPGRKNFDLNNINGALEPKQVLLKNIGCGLDFENNMQVKRSFAEAFDKYGECGESKKLSLLVWSGQPNDGDDRQGQKTSRSFATTGKNNDEEIVGWPPIKSWRRKLFHGHHHYHENQGLGIVINGRANADAEKGIINGVRNSIFVKVKMAGVAIGRKIDLTQFNSYQSLTNTLINMFAKYKESYKDDGPYILSYLDKEGDWLLAGDVPWQIFIDSVKRMEISKQIS